METNAPITAPVLFIIFSTVETTRKVFEAIRAARPQRLFVFSDGPRPKVAGEREKCLAAQQIATRVDWPCELKTLFLEENLGPRKGVARGIEWFFENVDEGMILEHDCLPAMSFFSFCQEMLERYRDDERVMHVCGGNYQHGAQRGRASYYFSRYPQIWGWATWKRAWKHYDVDMKAYGRFLEDFRLDSLFRLPAERKFWKRAFADTISRKIATVWDFQWVFAVLSQNGLAVTPNRNLVSNIGFGEEALHMSFIDKKTAALPIFELDELSHPEFVLSDVDADATAFKNLFTLPPVDRARVLLLRVAGKLRKLAREAAKR
jgi:hypothetical protein